MDLYGVSAEWLAEVTGCHIQTARRWKRTQNVPPAIAKLIRLFLDGDLGILNPAWAGWTLNRHGLFPPHDRRPFHPGHLLAHPFRMHLIAALQRKIREIGDGGPRTKPASESVELDVVETTQIEGAKR